MPEQTRAVVAVAASAGGVDALRSFVGALPADLDATVLVVLHVAPTAPSLLPEILDRSGPLPARHAREGERLEAGVVLVAPPDRHLVVAPGVVHLDAGPREDGHRPSANVLLSSAARTYGKRVAGVVLSGTMDDGAAGLAEVRAAGGLALVQDPGEAAFAGMPVAAIEAADPQLVGAVAALAERLVCWVRDLSRIEEGLEVTDPDDTGEDGDQLTPFTCPECGGTLWLEDAPGSPRFRCRVGHRFSAESLWLGKKDATEAALWAAVVALRERADVSERVASRLEERGNTRQLGRYRHDAEESRRWAEHLRALIPGILAHTVTEEHDEEDHDDART